MPAVYCLPARRGGIPGLIPTQLSSIVDGHPRVIAMSIFDAWDSVDCCHKTGKSLVEFYNLHGFELFLTLSPTSFFSCRATDSSVSCDMPSGRVSLTLQHWSDFVRVLKPTYAEQLYDTASLCEISSAKRKRTSCCRTARWFQECSSQCPPGCVVLSPNGVDSRGEFDGNSNLNESIGTRFFQIRKMMNRDADIKLISADNVPAMILAILSGATHVVGDFPVHLSEKGIALILSKNTQKPTLNLHDSTLMNNLDPLQNDCRCFTCKRHTKAYLCHLLSVNEMNAFSLLLIHNLTQLVDLAIQQEQDLLRVLRLFTAKNAL